MSRLPAGKVVLVAGAGAGIGADAAHDSEPFGIRVDTIAPGPTFAEGVIA